MNWKCGYATYEAYADPFTYVVTQQWRRSELMWFAYMHTEEDRPPQEVPGPLPLNRRQAMNNCEEHAKEMAHG